MDAAAFKKKYILETELGIDVHKLGRVLSIIDFGNVNHWFEQDRQDADNKLLAEDEKLSISLAGLHDFASFFSDNTRFYYGHDRNDHSLGFIMAAKNVFGKNRVFTKQIQKIRHHLAPNEIDANTRTTFVDQEGTYIHLPKCNFDVEISVDAIRLLADYDTLLLFSGDADFVSLVRFLKKNDKKVILVKGGHITADLRRAVDRVVNAQVIKRHISMVKKQKPGTGPGFANREPVSTGR